MPHLLPVPKLDQGVIRACQEDRERGVDRHTPGHATMIDVQWIRMAGMHTSSPLSCSTLNHHALSNPRYVPNASIASKQGIN